MTEAEWLAARGPETLILHLGNTASERKVRLFGVTCCRRLDDMIGDERGHHAVELGERYADRGVTDEELEHANRGLWDAIMTVGEEVFRSIRAVSTTSDHVNRWPEPAIVSWATYMASWCAAQAGDRERDDDSNVISPNEQAAQAALFRDIFGNPFRSAAVDPAWLAWQGGTVPAIARRVYDERAFHDLPILADALEDAGCADADLLAHCRGGGPHVRGCWSVDVILGRQ
jgi:hypothetical protein